MSSTTTLPPTTVSVTATKPIIHLGGTSADELIEQQLRMVGAIRDALDALRTNGPNARDFYPEPGAWERAQAEHESELLALRTMRVRHEIILEHLADLRDARRKGPAVLLGAPTSV